jgi:hypothetical protein
MVARLSARLLEEGLAGCEARVMDGQALDLPDGSFDVTFSIFGLILFPHWRRGFAELARVTHLSGRMVLAGWDSHDGGGPTPAFLNAYRLAFPEVPIPPLAAGMSYLRDLGNLQQEFRAVGMSDVEVFHVEGLWREPSRGWLLNNLDRVFGSTPLLSALDEAGRERLRVSLSKTLAPFETFQGACIPSSAWVGIGRRFRE